MTDPLDRLEKLTNLYERGALTREEFDKHKLEVLSGIPAPPLSPAEGQPSSNQQVARRNWLLAGGGATSIFVAAGLYFLVPKSEEIVGDKKQVPVPATVDDPTSLVSFEDVQACLLASATRDLLQDLEQGADDNGLLPVVGKAEPVEVRRRIEKVDGKAARLFAADVREPWNGLTLQRIVSVRWDDLDVAGVRLEFKEAPAAVRPVLRQLGWTVENVGEVRQGSRALFALEATSGTTTATCYPRPRAEGESADEDATDTGEQS